MTHQTPLRITCCPLRFKAKAKAVIVTWAKTLVSDKPGWVLLWTLFIGHVCRVYGQESMNDLLSNTSNLLDSLLSEENYDRQIRPGFGGPPIEILTDIEIRSFGSISENDMILSMDCYFRQTWYDPRLKFHSRDRQLLSMDWKFLQRVWTPDTYFLNGRSSYLHKVTVPNKFIRVRSDGQMRYSMRLTIKANCPMHLRKYPLDTQACPLEIGSFAYSTRDLLYKWKGSTPVSIASDVTLSQYDFLNISTANFTVPSPGGGVGSSLLVRFILRRRRGYFILQIYAPCAMIVGASWVSFWINRNDAAGRVAVGATTVLTLVTMGFGGRAALPRVAYATAMDWFIIMCFTFVFTAMVEYAWVNFVDRSDTIMLQRKLAEKKMLEEKVEQESNDLKDKDKDVSNDEDGTIKLKVELPEQKKPKLNKFARRFRTRFQRKCRRRYKEFGISDLETISLSSLERGGLIDYRARVVFPVAFTTLNILYWTLYLYTIDDEIPIDPPMN